MMPDLGKYTVVVLSAYGATFLLLAALVFFSWLRGRRVFRALREVEERRAARKGAMRETAAKETAGTDVTADKTAETKTAETKTTETKTAEAQRTGTHG